MPRLILSLDTEILAEYKMAKERFTIGRLPGNDLRIDHPAVSGQHAIIINILSDAFLEDLGSTNGTYVNGSLIKKHALQHGDLITCGLHQIRFLDEPTEKASDHVRHATTTVIPPELAPKPDRQSAATEPTRASLHILSGPSAGQTLPLVKSVTTVGRPDIQVAAITRQGDAYYLVHVESAGPNQSLLLNDAPIGPKAVPLAAGDIITVAGIKMGFFSAEESVR
jgi:predicted component of type VI protein secretion system